MKGNIMRPLTVFTYALLLTALAGPLSAMDVPRAAPEKSCYNIAQSLQELPPTVQQQLGTVLDKLLKVLKSANYKGWQYRPDIYKRANFDDCLDFLLARVKEMGYGEEVQQWCELIAQADQFVYRNIRGLVDFELIIGTPSQNLLHWTPQTILDGDYFAKSPFLKRDTADHILKIMEKMGAIEVYYLVTECEPSEKSDSEWLSANLRLIQKRWDSIPLKDILTALEEIKNKYGFTDTLPGIDFWYRMSYHFAKFMDYTTGQMEPKNIYKAFQSLIINPDAERAAYSWIAGTDEHGNPLSVRDLKRRGANYKRLKDKKRVIAKRKAFEDLAITQERTLVASIKTVEEQVGACADLKQRSGLEAQLEAIELYALAQKEALEATRQGLAIEAQHFDHALLKSITYEPVCQDRYFW